MAGPRTPKSGPSDRVYEWTAYLQSVGDWLIDARRRWREGESPRRGTTPRRRYRWLVTGTSVLIALVSLVEHGPPLG